MLKSVGYKAAILGVYYRQTITRRNRADCVSVSPTNGFRRQPVCRAVNWPALDPSSGSTSSLAEATSSKIRQKKQTTRRNIDRIRAQDATMGQLFVARRDHTQSDTDPDTAYLYTTSWPMSSCTSLNLRARHGSTGSWTERCQTGPSEGIGLHGRQPAGTEPDTCSVPQRVIAKRAPSAIVCIGQDRSVRGRGTR